MKYTLYTPNKKQKQKRKLQVACLGLKFLWSHLQELVNGLIFFSKFSKDICGAILYVNYHSWKL